MQHGASWHTGARCSGAAIACLPFIAFPSLYSCSLLSQYFSLKLPQSNEAQRMRWLIGLQHKTWHDFMVEWYFIVSKESCWSVFWIEMLYLEGKRGIVPWQSLKQQLKTCRERKLRCICVSKTLNHIMKFSGGHIGNTPCSDRFHGF